MKYKFTKNNGGDFIFIYTNFEKEIIQRGMDYLYKDKFEAENDGEEELDGLMLFNSFVMEEAQEQLGIENPETITYKVVQEMNKFIPDYFLMLLDIVLDKAEGKDINQEFSQKVEGLRKN